jgi:hypothetical protein
VPAGARAPATSPRSFTRLEDSSCVAWMPPRPRSSPARAAKSLPSGDHETADPTIEGEALLRYFAVDLLQPIFASRYSQTNQLICSGASLDEP